LSPTRSLLAALGLGVFAILLVSALSESRFDFGPGDRAFARLVAGATSQGTVRERAVVVLAGLERNAPRQVQIRVSGVRSLGVAVDRGPISRLRTSPEGVVAIGIDASGRPGARLDLLPLADEGAFRLESIRVLGNAVAPPIASALAAGLLTALLVLGVSLPRGAGTGAALGLVFAGSFALAWTPPSTWLAFPDRAAVLRLAAPALLLGIGLVWGLRSLAGRAFFGRAALLAAAFVIGLFLRVSFLASAGSWDTDIWKAWMLRSVSHGWTRAYGDPGAVPEGRFWAQVRGEEDPWKIPYAGREFTIDYPPLAILSWHASFRLVASLAPALDYGEAQNVAVKLPAVFGDALALVVLLWALRDSRDRGLAMAALYWCLPIAWYSSALLGFLDGAFAPFALAALVAATRGRPSLAGLLAAVAFWIKPLAVIVAPAIVVALLVPRSPGRSFRAIGKAVAPAVLVSLVVSFPYWLDDTLDTMVVHLARLFAAGNLSSGYANPWWIAGQFLAVSRGEGSWSAPVSIVALREIDLPLSLLGTSLVALVTAAACAIQYRQCRSRMLHATLVSAASAFLAYSILGMGVFENHPHFAFLLLLATGLPTRSLKLFFGATASAYVLNLYFLGGLGRFYGLRYWILEGAATWHASARMALGFDATLVLALSNSAAFALWLLRMASETRARGYDAKTT
jgi:hypothetical protein